MQYGLTTDAIVKMANKVQGTLTGDFAEVRRIVDRAELVIAVWQDRSESDGVGTMLIKGRGALRDIAFGAGNAKELRWSAIPCTCAEQAEALRQVCGSAQDLVQ